MLGQTSRQDPVDWQGWTSAKLNLDLPKKYEAYVEYERRYDANISIINAAYLDLGFSKKLSKKFKVLAQYRLAKVENRTFNRYTFGAEYGQSQKKNSWGYRALFLNKLYEFDNGLPDILFGDAYSRFKIFYERELTPKIAIGLSSEYIFNLSEGIELDNIRNKINANYQINKNGKLDLFYMYRPDFAKKYNRTFHILGISYTHQLKIAKNKKSNI